LDLLWWPFDGAQPFTEGAMRFLSALTGGVFVYRIDAGNGKSSAIGPS
jgi:hypothetical protein